MKVAITLDVDTDTLSNRDDAHLAALWHVAQANPAPAADQDAGQLVQAISTEIVRRWLQAAPVLLHEHQPDHHYWSVLQAHGAWTGPGRSWQPDPERIARKAQVPPANGGSA
jgi:hypothetical protein